MLRIKKITIIAVLVAGLLAIGLYFLLNPKQKITTVPLESKVATVEQAYDIAYNYANKICPEPELYFYGITLFGKEKILSERASGYFFNFDGMDKNFQYMRAVWITIIPEDMEMTVVQERDSGYYAFKSLMEKPEEIDVNAIVDKALTEQNMGTLEQILKQDPETIISIMRKPVVYSEKYTFKKIWEVKITTSGAEKIIEDVELADQ